LRDDNYFADRRHFAIERFKFGQQDAGDRMISLSL
jgi:hypothetical protein